MIISLWLRSLAALLDEYEERRAVTRSFYPKLYLFFVILNIS